MNFTKSQEWLERARKCVPYPWTQTFSKGVNQYVEGASPVYADHGEGCYLYDVDGNRYVDLVMGLMPVILGYGYIEPGISSGSPIFSLPHPSEVELSELLCELIPCAEMVRLGKNGSDATTAAVRVARAYTGRDVVLSCGYHGWHDWYVGGTYRNAGVPEYTKKLTKFFNYNDEQDFVNAILTYHPACVIMEPVNFIEPEEFLVESTVLPKRKFEANFLERVRHLCDKNGVVLIFDEIITGFRFALGGAQEYFDVIPDLACVGKSMANGMPISAVVGKRKIMERFGDVHYSFTFGGEVLSIAAALQVINYIRKNDVISYLWKIGGRLKEGLTRLIVKHGLGEVLLVQGYDVWPRLLVRNSSVTDLIGDGPRTEGRAEGIEAPQMVKSYISQELIKRGVLWLESFNLSYAHKPRHVDRVLAAFDEIFADLGAGVISIEGRPITGKKVR